MSHQAGSSWIRSQEGAERRRERPASAEHPHDRKGRRLPLITIDLGEHEGAAAVTCFASFARETPPLYLGRSAKALQKAVAVMTHGIGKLSSTDASQESLQRYARSARSTIDTVFRNILDGKFVADDGFSPGSDSVLRLIRRLVAKATERDAKTVYVRVIDRCGCGYLPWELLPLEDTDDPARLGDVAWISRTSPTSGPVPKGIGFPDVEEWLKWT